MARRLTSLLALAVLGCSAPSVAQFKPGVKDQIKLGKQAAAQVKKEAKVLPDTDKRVILLRQLGQKLVDLIPAEEKKKRPFEYSFDIVDDKEVNAFALPGGPIFIHTGLWTKLKTVDALVGVLGHEIAHVREEHWASAYNDNQKRQLGLTALLLIFNANKTVFDLASIGDALIFELPYSRSHETRADTSGFDLMTRAGFNPQGMVDVFTMFEELKKGGKPPEMLSTHPDDKNRIKRLTDLIKKSGKQYPEQAPLPQEPEKT